MLRAKPILASSRTHPRREKGVGFSCFPVRGVGRAEHSSLLLEKSGPERDLISQPLQSRSLCSLASLCVLILDHPNNTESKDDLTSKEEPELLDKLVQSCFSDEAQCVQPCWINTAGMSQFHLCAQVQRSQCRKKSKHQSHLGIATRSCCQSVEVG